MVGLHDVKRCLREFEWANLNCMDTCIDTEKITITLLEWGDEVTFGHTHTQVGKSDREEREKKTRRACGRSLRSA